MLLEKQKRKNYGLLFTRASGEFLCPLLRVPRGFPSFLLPFFFEFEIRVLQGGDGISVISLLTFSFDFFSTETRSSA